MKRMILLSTLAALAALSSGCATMINGSTDDVSFQATPAGARILVEEEEHVLPWIGVVPRDTKSVTFRAEGLADMTVPLDTKMGFGMLILDILFTPGFGIVGIIVDSSTGAWHDLPPLVRVNMETREVFDGVKTEVPPEEAPDAAVTTAFTVNHEPANRP